MCPPLAPLSTNVGHYLGAQPRFTRFCRPSGIGLSDAKYLNFKWIVLYSPSERGLTPSLLTQNKAAYRFQREVTMEHLNGPIFYVLIAWAVVTGIFMMLLLRRSLLASHEDDQIFLDGAQEHMAREQREIVAKIHALSRPLMTSGIVSGVLLLVLAGLWLYNGLKNI